MIPTIKDATFTFVHYEPAITVVFALSESLIQSQEIQVGGIIYKRG